MKEIIFPNRKPAHIEGHVVIDLTDPITGKVKNRVDGKNIAFPDSVFSFQSGADWQSQISGVPMILTDAVSPADVNLPFVFGQLVGIGLPSQNTLGTYRGAYNAASQVLAQKYIDKMRWKFVYNFTTPQANTAPIKSVGLSHQFNWFTTNAQRKVFSGFTPVGYTTPAVAPAGDGRYSIWITSAGVVTKLDQYTNVSTVIDLSATVGNNTSNQKGIGYNPQTGQWGILVMSATAGSRKLYIYSDNTFSSLVNTYNPSNYTVNTASPFYFYGNFFFNGIGAVLYYFDYINNNSQTAINLPAEGYTYSLYSPSGYTVASRLFERSIAYGKYILSFGYYGGTTYSPGAIYDMDVKTFAGFNCSPTENNGIGYGAIFYPATTTGKLFGCWYSGFNHSNALTAYNLPAPVTKTSANAMTATYELEVYW